MLVHLHGKNRRVVIKYRESFEWEKIMDKIIIKDLKVNGIIGIYDRERKIPQEIVINAILHTNTRKAAETDDIADCVDYEKMANRIKAHVLNAKRQTVEALTEDIARLCLETAQVERVNIKVEKTQAIPFTTSVGVEIERER